MTISRTFAGAAARTTLNGAITAGSPTDGGTFTLTSGTGYPTANFVIAVFVQAADGTRTGEEKIFVSARSGNLCTVGTAGRGFDSTTAANHGNGALVEHCLDADVMTKLVAHVNDSGDDHLQYQKVSTLAEAIQDIMGALVSGGSGLTLTYNDGANTYVFDVNVDASTIEINADTLRLKDGGTTLAKLANLANATIIGRNTAGTGVPEAVTMTQLKTLLALTSANISDFTAAVNAISGLAVTVVKTNDESVTSSVALQNDDELKVALAANTEYGFECWLYYTTAGAADLKIAFTVPTSALLLWSTTWWDDTGVALKGADVVTGGSDVTTAFLAGGSTLGWIRVSGSVRTSSTAGDLQLRWAQNTSSATPSVVKAGSTMRTQVGS